MKHDEFIELVRYRAVLPSREAAEVATNVVLETLAEWLLGNEATDTLAEWVLGEPADATVSLPKGIAGYLEYARSEIGEPFFLNEFFRRVSQKAEISLSDAVFQSGVVVEVLQEAIARGEDEEMRFLLFQNYLTLFEAASEGKVKVDY